MFRTLAFAAAAALLTSPASALPVSADITESLDLPANPSSFGPRILQNLGEVFGPQVELDGDDQIQNPSGWDGFVEVDFASDGLSFGLRHIEEFTDFQTFELVIDDIQFSTPGERIAGVTRTSPSIVDSLSSDPFTEALSFTADSIRIGVSVDDVPSEDIFNFFEGGTASYAITTRVVGAEIPLPAAAPLLAAGLAGLGWATRRRRRG
ncbi:MAG: hypothetical protein AAF763_09040 [Pseudomonadota bacterium]